MLATTVAVHSTIFHAYVLLGFPMTRNSLECFKLASDTLYWSSLIAQLVDDLGTYKVESARGDVSKSIECCMMEEQVSEEEAASHIKRLISSSWKCLNETI
ncbi:unnamed protein product, partial [Ilex paraguariensis]